MTTPRPKAPKTLNADHLTYLDELRDSGDTNMWAAAPWLQAEFFMSHENARAILAYWMNTYDERHKETK